MSRSARHSRKKTLTGLIVVPVMIIIIAVLFVGIKWLTTPRETTYDISEIFAQGVPDMEALRYPGPPSATITIRCAGDIMCHKPQFEGAYDSATKTYSFMTNYDYVRDFLAAADLTMANIECTFKGDGNYRGYPTFNTPDEVLDAVKSFGTDVCFFANNHMLDTGLSGLERTVQIIRDRGMAVAGAWLTGDDPCVVVDTEAGIRVGVVAYTYETQLVNGRRTLNGGYIPNDALDQMNSFRYGNEEDLARIKADIEACRDAGAHVVLAYMHWGEEYQTSPTKSEAAMAQAVADAGADVIVASHPHVCQKIDMLTSSVGKVVPCYYSIGNFISNQRVETLGGNQYKYTEEGLIANIVLTYNFGTGEISFDEISALPTWVEKYTRKGTAKPNYWIIPLIGDFENNPDIAASGHAAKARQALEDLKGIIGEAYIYKGAWE
ncbi:MAG: CapA family protein [Firmicutes bacterium]|nr:CapA family protein [Bacillota bacterium]